MKLKLLAVAALCVPVIAVAQTAPATSTTTSTTMSSSESTTAPKMVVHHKRHHRHHHHHATMTHKSSMTKTDAAGTETTTKTDSMSTPK